MNSKQSKTKTSPVKQEELFGSYRTMTLMDCVRESGRLRRVMYGKMMREQQKQALTKIQSAPTEKGEEHE